MKIEKSYLTVFPDSDYFTRCAFLCVDIQEQPGDSWDAPRYVNQIPDQWIEQGFTVEDVNASADFLHNVCRVNAPRVVKACRRFDMPMIFIHWGSRYRGLIDLDPAVRKDLLTDGQSGTVPQAYSPESQDRPASFLEVKPEDYILMKTAQDAFEATPLAFMLENLHVKNLILIGGHTGACLGKTSKSAKKLGYKTLVVEDATHAAFESTRIKWMLECGYDYVVETETLEKYSFQFASEED